MNICKASLEIIHNKIISEKNLRFYPEYETFVLQLLSLSLYMMLWRMYFLQILNIKYSVYSDVFSLDCSHGVDCH